MNVSHHHHLINIHRRPAQTVLPRFWLKQARDKFKKPGSRRRLPVFKSEAGMSDYLTV
jgi:hypothetical protein